MDLFCPCISKSRYIHIRGLQSVVKASTLVVTPSYHIWSIQIFGATFIYYLFKLIVPFEAPLIQLQCIKGERWVSSVKRCKKGSLSEFLYLQKSMVNLVFTLGAQAYVLIFACRPLLNLPHLESCRFGRELWFTDILQKERSLTPSAVTPLGGFVSKQASTRGRRMTVNRSSIAHPKGGNCCECENSGQILRIAM